MHWLKQAFLALAVATSATGENWLQFKFDSRQSGNVPNRALQTPLGLLAAVPLSDSIFTALVVADGKVYVVDGAGIAWCLDANPLRVLWKFATPGGNANCNNLSSPALADGNLHFGTMAGRYYVLDAATGRVRKEIFYSDQITGAFISQCLARGSMR